MAESRRGCACVLSLARWPSLNAAVLIQTMALESPASLALPKIQVFPCKKLEHQQQTCPKIASAQKCFVLILNWRRKNELSLVHAACSQKSQTACKLCLRHSDHSEQQLFAHAAVIVVQILYSNVTLSSLDLCCDGKYKIPWNVCAIIEFINTRQSGWLGKSLDTLWCQVQGPSRLTLVRSYFQGTSVEYA